MEINVNPKFHFLYNKDELAKYREIIFYGGRGAGKTYQLTQFFLYKALTEKCRILCLREFSNSNKNSLLSEFENAIIQNNLEAEIKELIITGNKERAIKIHATEIIFTHNDSRILFAGINDNTAINLKSISNINYCWVEESSFLTEYAYNILKPTIRAENSKIFFSFNPQSKEDFIYQKVLNAKNEPLTKAVKVTYADNPFFPSVLETDRRQAKGLMPIDLYNHIWEGEPLEFNDSQVINTNLFGYYDKIDFRFDEVFICADTAYSKKESADFSVIGVFGLYEKKLYFLRLLRGRWDFNELQTMLKSAYEWACDNYAPPQNIIIEKKASGISLLQELKRTTNLPISEITPKTDKFSRVSDVLTELSRIALPLEKNPLNSWVDDFIAECKAFRSDLKHNHDDQVDVMCYALQHTKQELYKVNWYEISKML